MSEPFLGEIKLVSFGFAPKGWAACNGQLLPINQNQALFSLLGTMYGGDGRVTFALPDLRGRIAFSVSSGAPGITNRPQGQAGGSESVKLLKSQLASHGHRLRTAAKVAYTTPAGNSPASSGQPRYAVAPDESTQMNAGMIAVAGSSTPHDNLQPFLALTYVIALQGIYPSR